MTYRFIQTDQVATISESERDLSTLHEGHDPEDHVCDRCVRVEKEDCWAERHGKEVTHHPEARPVGDCDDTDCHCACHYLADQCRFSQAAAENEGRPFYRLETEHDGWSMVLPAAVYEAFMALADEDRDEIVESVIAQAKQLKRGQVQSTEEE